MSYQRPILIEIYAELFFEPGSLSFAQMLEIVQPLHRRGFTTIESGEATEAGADRMDGAEAAARMPVIRSWTEDRARLVQLAPDKIAMNLMSPEGSYPGWNLFVSGVMQPTIDVVRQVAPRARPASVALNTLDRFTIPPGVAVGEFLNCGGPRIPSILADTTQPFDYDVGRGLLQTDGRNRQLHLSGHPTEGAYLITILAVFHEKLGDGEDVLQKLERLHNDSNESFESLITDRTRSEVMKGLMHAVTSL